MEVQQVMYMLMVEDMERAVRFYTDVMGFRARVAEERWSELAFGDFTLALHIAVGDGAEGKGQKGRGLSISVVDIEAACREVEAAGGQVINPPQEGDFPGLKVALVADTEGNAMELGEHTN